MWTIGGLTLFFCGANRLTKQTNQSICCDPASRNISCERVTEAAASVFIWCDTLELQSQLAANPTSYGANTKHTCTYGAIRADCLFEFYGATWVLPSVISQGCAKGSVQTDNCSSCPAEAMQVSNMGEMCLVYTHRHTQTHTVFLWSRERHTMKSSVITWDVSLPHRLNTHKHTHTPMSSIPLPLYNLGTIFIWCYWVKLDGFLYSCGYSEELAKYVYQTFKSMKQSNSFMLTAYVKTATLSVSVKHIKATMPYLLDWSGGGFFFSFFFSVCVWFFLRYES